MHIWGHSRFHSPARFNYNGFRGTILTEVGDRLDGLDLRLLRPGQSSKDSMVIS